MYVLNYHAVHEGNDLWPQRLLINGGPDHKHGFSTHYTDIQNGKVQSSA